jgi:hypothetical protein
MKKLLLKSISLMIVLIMASSTLLSCASKLNEENGSDSDSDQVLESGLIGGSDEIDGETVNGTENYTPEVDASKFPENAFPIFDGTAYTVRVVVSDTASATERQVATTLRSELKKKTNTTISQSTDYLKNGESYDSSAYEILVGKTNHPESTGIYNATSYNNYGIKTIGNKIILYFSTLDEGTELASTVIKALQRNDSNAFWIEGAISTSKIASPVLTALPKYPADSLSTVDCADNTSMIVAKSTTLAKFNEYCTSLTSSGFAEYSKRENVDGNYFRTYTKGNTAVTAYFSNGRKQARIIVGPIKDIPSKDVDDTKENFKPSVTMIGPSESVSGSLTIIYQLANGKFLIIDGGIILADRIYKKLREFQPNASKLTIAGWVISHPHNDHQDGIEYFIEQHGYEVDIENIYFNYAQADYYNNPTDKDHTTEREGARVSKLRDLCDKYLTRSTKIVKPHTGQIYNFGSASMEIISTVEDLLPTKMPFVNDTSMVVRVTVAGQSNMLLADASSNMKGIIRSMYDSHVKSDMVTLAHHGVWDTTPELYNEIKGKVLFWPNNTAGARMYYTDKSSSSGARQAIQAALNNAKDVFLAKGTDTTLNLPYTPVGNKQSFINSTLK